MLIARRLGLSPWSLVARRAVRRAVAADAAAAWRRADRSSLRRVHLRAGDASLRAAGGSRSPDDSARRDHPRASCSASRRRSTTACSSCSCRCSSTLLLLWLQDIRLPLRTTLQFAAALLADDAGDPDSVAAVPARAVRVLHAVVVPPVRRRPAAAVVRSRWRALPEQPRNLAMLAGMAVVLLLPLARQISSRRSISRRHDRAARRPSPRCTRCRCMTLRAAADARASPVLLAAGLADAVHRRSTARGEAWQERATAACSSGCAASCGLALLITQLRLHYFGSFALYLPWLVLAQSVIARWHASSASWSCCRVARPAAGVLAARRVTSCAWRGAGRRPTTSARCGRSSRTCSKACAQDPGIVLADNDAGHYIRYYTRLLGHRQQLSVDAGSTRRRSGRSTT